MERFVGILGGLVGAAVAAVCFYFVAGLPVGAGLMFGVCAGVFPALGAMFSVGAKQEINVRRCAVIGALTLLTLGVLASVVGMTSFTLTLSFIEFMGMASITTIVGGAAGLGYGYASDFHRFWVNPIPTF